VAFCIYVAFILAINAIIPQQIGSIVNAHDVIDSYYLQFRKIHHYFQGSSSNSSESVYGDIFHFFQFAVGYVVLPRPVLPFLLNRLLLINSAIASIFYLSLLRECCNNSQHSVKRLNSRIYREVSEMKSRFYPALRLRRVPRDPDLSKLLYLLFVPQALLVEISFA